MRSFTRLILLAGLALAASPTYAMTDPGDIGTVIESFVTRQFPDAASHFWIVNDTQWDGDEIIVDMNAIVTEQRQTPPTESRFLLLIVEGQIKGIQSIPLDTAAECQKEQEV
ncbi:MAG: hypothetical protein JSR64_20585 [Nitrospira sp.]|jgi:hypothetical protein|nr:hypothetical protein [Nitrospira sp.]MBS0176436.1 hypothetical protein [Nitrospira sp.]MBX3338153.1 hypothetical protein [Nitrospira sp.]MCW5779278.1 hypothetical protein [Nitrospira sp.]HMZ56254.1 hypothetical protein [Nitrospira sp.]